MRENPDIRLVRNPNYRSAGTLYSLDLALRSAEPGTADEGLLISSRVRVYDDDAIERASRVSGGAIVGDSSRCGAASTKIIGEHGTVATSGCTTTYATNNIGGGGSSAQKAGADVTLQSQGMKQSLGEFITADTGKTYAVSR
jgi:choline kinase